MPANNPIVGGQHVTSYSNGPGSLNVAPIPGPVTPYNENGNYNIPVAVVVGIALLILLLFRVWGFQALVSARVG